PFFVLLIRRSPTAPPFPYTTLFRSKNHTGMPFVFAVWASNKPIDEIFISEFNTALKFGLDNRQKVIDALPRRDDIDLGHYLMHQDRKSTRLNSSHVKTSYAVFCLKK